MADLSAAPFTPAPSSRGPPLHKGPPRELDDHHIKLSAPLVGTDTSFATAT
jgi:hypothetical protein